jgi:hypothetical protein
MADRGFRVKASGSGSRRDRWLLCGTVLAAIMTAPSVRAQEVNPTTGEEAQGLPAPEAEGQRVQFSYGVGLTTNYISKGLTQTDNQPAIQPYLELGYGIGYLGFWASNASFGGVNDNELDVSIGARPEFGKWSFDLGFVQYFYQKDDATTAKPTCLASMPRAIRSHSKANTTTKSMRTRTGSILGAAMRGCRGI